MNWGCLGGAVLGFLVVLVVTFPPGLFWLGGVVVLAGAVVGGIAYPLWRYR